MPESGNSSSKTGGRHMCLSCAVVMLGVILILGLTVFMIRNPKITVLPTNVAGAVPSISFPLYKIEPNVILGLHLLVENRNRGSFKHSQRQILVLYHGQQVGYADVGVDQIAARGSEKLNCRLTIATQKLFSNMTQLSLQPEKL
ncbi:uncharacterized protein LOC143883125 [Tasmannia lanceolata]|uniref:uncharacterized protein LOC143883125 n=1 Tax=Tasmannia lanceolata TaxID=3420 RepID=UPI004064676B